MPNPPIGPLAAARHLDGASGTQLLAEASAAAGAELLRTRLRSIHHRPGRSISHVHEATLRIEETEHEVLLVAHVDAEPLPERTFVLARGQDRVAVWRFPHDPFLPGLPSAIDPPRVRELLDRLGGVPGVVHLHTRAYRPARRAVVEVRLDGERQSGRILYLKLLTGNRASDLASIHRTLAPLLPVPGVVGVAPAQGIVALEALAGTTLRHALVSDGPLPEPEELVALSERFASSGLTTRRDPRAFADAHRHVEGLAGLVPDRAEQVARVAAEAARVDGPLVPVHGDLHGGQLLLDAGGRVTGLLDVDGAGMGFSAHDAGNLVAHLEVMGELHPAAAGRAGDYAAAVADAYRPVVGAGPLARATAGAWIGLATGPYRSQDRDWQERTHRRIDRALEVLSEGPIDR